MIEISFFLTHYAFKKERILRKHVPVPPIPVSFSSFFSLLRLVLVLAHRSAPLALMLALLLRARGMSRNENRIVSRVGLSLAIVGISSSDRV